MEQKITKHDDIRLFELFCKTMPAILKEVEELMPDDEQLTLIIWQIFIVFAHCFVKICKYFNGNKRKKLMNDFKDELYAVISKEKEKGEGIVVGIVNGNSYPLVCLSEEVARGMANIAKKIASRSGKTLQLVKLTNLEIIEEIKP